MIRDLRDGVDAALRSRRTATACVCFSLLTVPFLLIVWCLQAWALTHPDVLAYFQPGRLLAAQWGVGLLVLWQAGVAVLAWQRREVIAAHAPWWAAGALAPVLTGWSVLALLYGVQDTPMGMLLVEILVFARAFFPLRDLKAWMALGAVLIVGHELLQALEVAAYAPLLSRPMFDGHGLSDWWTWWLRIMFNASVLPFAAAVFYLFASLARQRTELESLARTDMLTGLANRREFMARLVQESQRQRRGDQPLSLVMLDVDHFKQINDTHGHPAGDRVLASLGALVRANVRQEVDLAARLGGEEFALLLPETDAEGAQRVARKIVEALRALPIEHAGHLLPVTVSAGVAQVHQGEGEQALRRADDCLYQAKRQGRDRVVAAEGSEPVAMS
ncbi:GGDEF domain-containing protein [Aquabacterium soli]|uniref:diguanylate cyclase n=1 Tax=Aquabacterium soli TaxID=2493092 RepID=A0A426V7W2_9BURK|nr:GGDEF domain-containing protein [Aquabacterium soli]RRS02963.1 GGDEF domain-containing protein [Aquabacterium soli]